MRKLATILILGLTLSMGTIGCATIAANLPNVIAAVLDSQMILDSISTVVDAYFKVKPNADQEKKVLTAMARARSALNAALRAAQGAEKLDQAQIDDAFKDFREAYTELLALTGPLGVTAQGKTFKAAPGGGLIVPEPLALTLKAR
jgi:hypothetical protein